MNRQLITGKVIPAKALLSKTVKEKMALIKQDVEDTISNQYQVLDKLLVLSSVLDAQDFTSAEFNTLLTAVPMTFVVNDTQYTLNVVPSSESYDLMIYEAGVNQLNLINTYDMQSINSADVLIETDQGEVDFLNGSIADISSSIASSNVVNALVDSALVTNSGSSVADRFALATSQYVSDANSAAAALRDETIQQLSVAGEDPKTILLILSSIYDKIKAATIDAHGKYEFNKDYGYVQGFVGQFAVAQALEIGSYILTGVLAVCAPVFSALGYLFGAIGSFISNKFNELSDSKPQANFEADNYLFSVPVLQVTGSRSQLISRMSQHSPEFVVYFEDVLAQMESTSHVFTCDFPNFTMLCWYNSVDDLSVEVYLNAAYNTKCTGSFIDRRVISGEPHLFFKQPTAAYSSVLTDLCHNVMEWFVTAQMRTVQDYVIDQKPVITGEIGSLSFTDNLWSNLTGLLIALGGNGLNAYYNTELDQSDPGIFGAISWIQNITQFGGNYDYETLCNTVLPEVRSHYGWVPGYSADECLYRLIFFMCFQNTYTISSPTLGRTADIINFYQLDVLDNRPVELFSPVYYLPDRGEFFLTPPKYSSNALFGTLAILIGAAAIVSATAVIATKVRNKVRGVLRGRYNELAADYTTLQGMEKGTPEHTALSNKIAKKTKSYNKIANLTGYSRVSYLNGWETGDNAVTAATNLKDSYYHDSLTDNDNLDIKAIIELIKG